MQAEEFLRAGKLAESLEALQSQVRQNPADAKLRVFLFQLLSVLGQWDKAKTQLKVAGELDAANLLMVHMYSSALDCEASRASVFAGTSLPVVFGEPEEWVGWLIQANRLAATGKPKAALKLRDQAFEAAPAVPGTVNGQAFEWIADSDCRLGPVLEAVIDGRYYWVPLTKVREIRVEEPTSLRDAVWTGAEFTWTNGGTSFGLIPTRYPGTEGNTGPAVRMARTTDWRDLGGGYFVGLGQRILATDQAEYGLMDVRHLRLQAAQEPAAGPAAEGTGDG